MAKDLSQIKDEFKDGEEKPKRKRRSRAELDAEKLAEKKEFITPEAVSLLSKGLISIISGLLSFQIQVEKEELILLNTASAECLNLYLPADSAKYMPLVNLTAVLASIAVKNLKEYRHAKKAETDAGSGKER